MTDSPSGPGSKDARLKRILANLSPRQREALYRFYSLGEDSVQVSRALGLDESELRELKSRVKREFQMTKWSQ